MGGAGAAVQRAIRIATVQTFAEYQIYQQHYSIQMAYYVQNRRDCWGYVQGSSPLRVKQIIWHHEEDELIGQKAQGKLDHITLAVKEGEVFGLSAKAFEKTARIEGGEVCFSAWIRLAQRSWLEAIAGLGDPGNAQFRRSSSRAARCRAASRRSSSAIWAFR